MRRDWKETYHFVISKFLTGVSLAINRLQPRDPCKIQNFFSHRKGQWLLLNVKEKLLLWPSPSKVKNLKLKKVTMKLKEVKSLRRRSTTTRKAKAMKRKTMSKSKMALNLHSNKRTKNPRLRAELKLKSWNWNAKLTVPTTTPSRKPRSSGNASVVATWMLNNEVSCLLNSLPCWRASSRKLLSSTKPAESFKLASSTVIQINACWLPMNWKVLTRSLLRVVTESTL